MGSDLYFETNKAQQDVFGNHATAFDCNKLVAMNESSMKYNAENKQMLLSLITVREVRFRCARETGKNYRFVLTGQIVGE